MKTTKVEPVFIDSEGVIYRKLGHDEGLRHPDAVRELLPSPDGGKPAVRWLLPTGTQIGSPAEKRRLEQLADVQSE